MYDGIIAPDDFEVADIVAYVTGTKTQKKTLSVCVYNTVACKEVFIVPCMHAGTRKYKLPLAVFFQAP
jgi:hypothetical protein